MGEVRDTSCRLLYMARAAHAKKTWPPAQPPRTCWGLLYRMPGRRCPGARWPREGWWKTARVSRQEGSSTGSDSCHPQAPSLLPADGKGDRMGRAHAQQHSAGAMHMGSTGWRPLAAAWPACLPGLPPAYVNCTAPAPAAVPVGPADMVRVLLRPQKGPHFRTKKQSDWLLVSSDTEATVSSRLPAGCGRGRGGVGGAAAGTPAASAADTSCRA